MRTAIVATILSGAPADADVIYRETFGIPPGSGSDLFATAFDWQRFDNNGAEITTTGTSSGVNFSALGRPVDVANVHAGPNSDGTFGPYANGILYLGATPSPSLALTTEYSFNPNDYLGGSILFSWYEGNNTAAHLFRVLIRVGGVWYSSATTFTTPVVSLANFGTQAQLKTLTYDPAAANWLVVNFDGDYVPGSTPATGTTTPSALGLISLGASPILDLVGAITGFGVYGESGGGTGNRRIDSFTIEGTPSTVVPGKTLTWEGSVSPDWDLITTNWRTNANPATTYADGDFARFDDSGTLSPNVNLSTPLFPGGVTVGNNSIAYLFGGNGLLGGSGGLIKQGSGSLVIANLGNNTFSGGTFIQAGTVQLGDGGAGGNLGSGNITNNGSLVINRTSDLTMTNAISGSGSLTKNSTGTLTLGGSNSYGGPTFVNAGTLFVNGILAGGGVLSNAPGTTLSGSGTNTGQVDVSGVISPGQGVGIFTSGGLTLFSGATATFELSNTNPAGGGINDLLQVNGNLALNNNTVSIAQLAVPQTNVPYRLINYTGTRSGNLNPAVVTGSRFTGALSYDDTAKQVNLTLTGGPANLRWNGISDGIWDVATSSNWVDLANSQPDVFYYFDGVLFDDTLGVQTTIDIAAGVTVRPSSVTIDSTNSAFTIGGEGGIGGTASITKLGPSTLILGGSNSHSGGLSISNGVARLTTLTAPGTGKMTVNSNGTLVAGAAHTNAITLAGGILGGVSGIGSLSGELTAVSNTTSTIYVSDPLDLSINSEMNFTGTLRGSGNINVLASTTVLNPDGGVGFRLRGTATTDFSGTITLSNSVKGELQTGVAGPFSPAGTGKIILVGGTHAADGSVNGNYSELNVRNNSTTNTFLGNNVEMAGTGLAVLNPLGSAPSNAVSTLGNLKIGAGQELGVIRNSGQPHIVAFQSVTLTGGAGYAIFSPKTPDFGVATATGSDLSLGNITELTPGSGIQMRGLRTLFLTGTNSYTGETYIAGGTLALVGNSSIGTSRTLIVDSFLSVTGRVGGILVVRSGQTLRGNGTVIGNVMVASEGEVEPGSATGRINGDLHSTGFIWLQGGTTVMKIVKSDGSVDLLQTSSNLIYGGTLIANNINQPTHPFAAGDSFKLFDALSYSGAFSSIVPATPGVGLAWDTSTLTSDGTIRVISGGGGTRPTIAAISQAGGNIVFSGSGGTSGATYSVLTSTNVTLPLSSWSPIATNQFDTSGNFNVTNAINPATPYRFFTIRVP